MPFEDNGTGSCINCGFLAKRTTDPSRSTFHEATASDRANDYLRQPAYAPQTVEWCFLGEANLQLEVESLVDERYVSDRTFDVIAKGRNCPRWFAWKKGLDPVAHFGGLATQEEERRRKEFELHLLQMR